MCEPARCWLFPSLCFDRRCSFSIKLYQRRTEWGEGSEGRIATTSGRVSGSSPDIANIRSKTGWLAWLAGWTELAGWLADWLAGWLDPVLGMHGPNCGPNFGYAQTQFGIMLFVCVDNILNHFVWWRTQSWTQFWTQMHYAWTQFLDPIRWTQKQSPCFGKPEPKGQWLE